MSDLTCVLVPRRVFVWIVGSECDCWSVFRANQGLRFIKKLLCFALTVRLFMGDKMNCSPPSP